MKFDLHTHTKASPDSWIPPAKLGAAAKKAGMDGVAITDHSSTSGWKEAKEGAKKAGVELILGEEVGVAPKGRRIGEIIGLFMTEQVGGLGMGALEVIDRLKAQGAVVVLPHPFDRLRKVFPEDELRELAVKIDVVEVFNAHVAIPSLNKKADEFADEFGLPKCAGSDAHSTREVGRAWTEAKAGSAEEFRKRLLAGKTTIGGGYQVSIFRFSATLAKIKNKLIGRKH